MAKQPFPYQPLATPTEIRVLQVSPSLDSNAEISAAFETQSLAPAASPEYDALSYMWGDQTQQTNIFINGTPFSISQHLCDALRTLRDAARPRRLWVDAICINQTDIHERNQQVQLMRTVYQRAKAVAVWLNHHVDASDAAFQKFSTLSAASTVADLGDSPDFWNPLLAMLHDPYWKRVWIQQEISNAASLRLFCRQAEVSVLSLYHFLRLNGEIQLQEIMGPSWRDWAHKNIGIGVTLPPRFGQTEPHLQPIQGTTIGEAPSDILETLSRTNNLQCTDDRDRVYGIMFLAQDCNPGDIPVDYTKPTPDAYTDVVRCVISKYRSTRFLLYATLDYGDGSNISDKTPSWVPDWRRPPARPALPRQLPPLHNLQPTPELNSALPAIKNDTLSLHALKIDTILKTYHHLFATTTLLSQTITEFITTCLLITQDAINLHSPLTQAELPTVAPTLKPETTPQWKSLIHTLAGLDNRGDNARTRNVDTILERGAEEILSLSRGSDQNINPDTHILGLILNYPQSSGALPFAKAFLTFTWWLMTQKRAPFLTSDGRLGLAPACAEVGDEAWLVPGCEAPVLLREVGDGTRRVVGEVYVDGANFWEPIGGVKGLGEVKEGEEIEKWRVEIVDIR